MFKENLLIQGKVEVKGEKVDLSKITCPVVVVTGEKDDITGPEQARAIGRYVSGPVSYIEIPKVGHFGAFSGEGSMRFWRENIFQLIRAA